MRYRPMLKSATYIPPQEKIPTIKVTAKNVGGDLMRVALGRKEEVKKRVPKDKVRVMRKIEEEVKKRMGKEDVLD